MDLGNSEARLTVGQLSQYSANSRQYCEFYYQRHEKRY